MNGPSNFYGHNLYPYIFSQTEIFEQTYLQQTNINENFIKAEYGHDNKDQFTDIDQNGLLEYIFTNHMDNQGHFYIYENSKQDLTGNWNLRTDLLEIFIDQLDDTLYMDINFADLDSDGDLDIVSGLVGQLAHPFRRPKTGLGPRAVPDKNVIFGHQNVGVTVAIKVDQPQVGIAPIDLRYKLEGPEGDPVAIVPLVETGHGPAQQYQVLLAIAGQIHNLLPAVL